MFWGVPFAPVNNSHLCNVKVMQVIYMRLFFPTIFILVVANSGSLPCVLMRPQGV